MRRTTGPTCLNEYFLALERLKDGCPNIVQKGVKISNDAVALEAGRCKGSIKKSRSLFAPLIAAISEAAAAQFPQQAGLLERTARAEQTSLKYRRLYEEAIAREISLLYEVYSLKKELSQLIGSNVLPIRSNDRQST